jgi:hypothetical protein
VGCSVGLRLGLAEGLSVGALLGTRVGLLDGLSVGFKDGRAEGGLEMAVAVMTRSRTVPTAGSAHGLEA